MRAIWTVPALLVWVAGCFPAETERCRNDCECWAALNRCIEQVADEIRSDDEVRAVALDRQFRTIVVPSDPTPEDLLMCTQGRNSQLLALRNGDVPELAHCENAREWDPLENRPVGER